MSKEEKENARKSYLYETSESVHRTYGIPLLIRYSKAHRNYRAYICLMNSPYQFPISNNNLSQQASKGAERNDRTAVEGNKYGWVILRGIEVGRLSIPADEDLWKGVVVIDIGGAGDTKTFHRDPMGVYEEHPYFSGSISVKEGNKIIPNSVPTKFTSNRVGVIKGFTERHNKYRLLAPTEDPLPRSYPRSGEDGKVYRQSVDEEVGQYRVNSLREELSLTKDGLKDAFDVSKKVRTQKKGFKRDGMLQQIDTGFKVVDKDGEEVQKMNKSFTAANWKVVEYPRLKPERFKMSGYRFNKLLRDAPSTMIQPIRQWVQAIGDVEEFAIAALMSVVAILSITKEFKPVEKPRE